MMRREEVVERIMKRIQDKKEGRVDCREMVDINNSLDKYPELSAREKDFAFNCAMQKRTYRQWSNYYQVSWDTIQRWMHNPRIIMLIDDITYNIRSHAAGLATLMLRASMMQYMRILNFPETEETLEPKRKAANDIMNMFKGREDKPFNINIFAGEKPSEVPREVRDTEVNVSVQDLQKELKVLEDMTDLTKGAAKYAELSKEPPLKLEVD